jgi:hypothetical protein
MTHDYTYSAIADLHTLQISAAHAKSFQSAVSYTNRSLVMASDSGDSSTSSLNWTDKVFSSQTPLQLTNF